ncbi:hypothetical protein ACIA5G_22325 [Amycolatopsis sp. NPDC051758]|uniref:hypothetical protein n=1 Tax=Amycolatopsis sp. NPDC051758 TaxID=3363935 RepID=UPI00379319BE
MTLEFPAVESDPEPVPFDELPPMAAPVLVPGTPPPPEPEVAVPAGDGRPWKMTAAVVGAVAAVVAVIVVVTVATTTTKRQPAASSPSDVAVPVTSVEYTPTPAPATTPDLKPTDESSAQQLLETQVTNDRPLAEALTGSWVPQLSSKKLGLVADGTTYDHRAIWADFTNLRARYPDALLLWSGDYSSFRLTNFWVTVVPRSSSSGASANSWCDGEGIDKDGCYAKLITHTGGYADSTVLRK